MSGKKRGHGRASLQPLYADNVWRSGHHLYCEASCGGSTGHAGEDRKQGKTEVPDLEQNQHAPQTVPKDQKKKCRCDLSSDPAVQQSDLPESKRQDR